MWVDVTIAKTTDSRRKAIALAVQTCYWVITQEVANCKYKAMVEFVQQQSLDNTLFLNRGANASYRCSSTITFTKLMEYLSGVSEQQLRTDLHQSAFIGIDESTDRATEKSGSRRRENCDGLPW